MSLGAVEGVPQAVLRALLYMFYDLSALRQVPPLAASEGVLAVVPGDFLRGRWATVTMQWEWWRHVPPTLSGQGTASCAQHWNSSEQRAVLGREALPFLAEMRG